MTLAEAFVDLLGLDPLSPIRHLPLEWAAKLAYVCMTTELSLALWWFGVLFCMAAAVSRLLRR